MDILQFALACMAAVAAGFINAIAGGGTLITFPVLLALGVPPVTANVTNTVALTPGILGGVYAQRRDFESQKKILFSILPVSILGGILGGLILLNTNENSFRTLVPFLILIAAIILALQIPVKNWITSRLKNSSEASGKFGLFSLIFLAAIYGGYFGAGLGVILMAVLGLVINDTLTRINVLKQAISFSINLSAAMFFSFTGKVDWKIAIIMACGAILGGVIGGKFASIVKPGLLKWIVVSTGITVAIIFFIKQ
jgi:uncharacterized membrane protein YfcA